MDAKFQALPPLKRISFRQQDNAGLNQSEALSSSLPAKKRKESRVLSDNVKSVHSYCLPAKKRVWALRPEFVSGGHFSPFDLNIEYKPADEVGRNLEDDKENISPLVNEGNQAVENRIPFCIEAVPETDKENKIPAAKRSRSIVNTNREDEGKKTDTSGLDLEAYEQLTEAVQECGGSEKLYLENERNHLVRNAIHQHEIEEEEEDEDGILCTVCESTDGKPSDPIVFCDGCDLMVHARCYGNPLIKNIPEGDWFCSQCLASKSSSMEKKGEPFSCCLCPIKGGALKPTNDARWAHVVCAVFVPEVFFEDPEGREGIDCSKVPKRRWGGKCYVCNGRKGCVLECSEIKCSLGFHVTCALKAGLCIEYKEGKKSAVIAGFCKSHSELWKKQQQTGKFKIVAKDEI